MMLDTADRARELADLFAQMAAAVDAYRTRHFFELSPSDRARLDERIQEIEDIHDRFTAQAIENTLQAIRDDLDQITNVTMQAKNSLQHLKTVQEVVAVAAAAAELGVDITSGDFGAIPRAIKDLTQAVAQNPDEEFSGDKEPEAGSGRT
jgi:hypothetical protein